MIKKTCSYWNEAVEKIKGMNVPNRLTLARLGLCAGLVLFLEWEWVGRGTLALIIFGIASSTDLLDGYLARKLKQETDFGKLMDPLVDKVLLSTVFVAMAVFGLAPMWVVICIISREFLITGMRMLAISKGVVLAAEKSGKHKTVSQMITAVVGLMVLAMWDANCCLGFMEYLEKFVLMPLVWITLGITIYSGVSFYRNNRRVILGEENG